ncbi:site-specific integrase [Scandinavium goeteborgense]|uniref:site-specific integrase n=1 Tax=Scandinavium goeteborgense TaxID=1851514 RepID=UPI0037FBE4EF
MASIRESGTGKRHRFAVSYRNETSGQNAVARPPTLDEAMRFFWQAELSERQLVPLADSVASVRRWAVQKAVWFWLGYQYSRVENHRLSLQSYSQYKSHLASLPAEILSLPINRLTPRRLGDLTVTIQKYLRFAFGALVSQQWLSVNPVGRLSGRTAHQIVLPEKKTIVAMLAGADVREKLAVLLGGVCGLRPGELVALRYSDLSEDKILIQRHLTDYGERKGTKRGPGRPVDMPAEVWALLDKSLLGTSRPVISGWGGRRLSLNYSKQGIMKRLLTEYGIERYYDLRHFAITNLLRRGVALADVAEFAGHKDQAMTARIYSHLAKKRPCLTGSLEGE